MSKTPLTNDLQQAPGVGPSIAKALRDIDIYTLEDLVDADPEAMYDELQARRGSHIDRCVLYVFRCAVYYASNRAHEPELLKWWNWKDRQSSRVST